MHALKFVNICLNAMGVRRGKIGIFPWNLGLKTKNFSLPTLKKPVTACILKWFCYRYSLPKTYRWLLSIYGYSSVGIPGYDMWSNFRTAAVKWNTQVGLEFQLHKVIHYKTVELKLISAQTSTLKNFLLGGKRRQQGVQKCLTYLRNLS